MVLFTKVNTEEEETVKNWVRSGTILKQNLSERRIHITINRHCSRVISTYGTPIDGIIFNTEISIEKMPSIDVACVLMPQWQ